MDTISARRCKVYITLRAVRSDSVRVRRYMTIETVTMDFL